MNSATTAVTLAATTDISELLAPSPAERRMSMNGFDEEFVDIVDYIIRITDRIWHEKKIDLCLRYYADDSVIHTMTGDIVGAQTVEQNTRDTLKAFPDRTLDADNVIWSGNDQEGFYSSHLITSRMTNEGTTEYGPPTNRRARIQTIADCVCLKNKIIEEWLVRDNSSLVQQLGYNVAECAIIQAQDDREKDLNLLDTVGHWRSDVTGVPASFGTLPKAEENPTEFALFVLGSIWGGREFKRLAEAYDFRVRATLPGERNLYGTVEYQEYLEQFHACFGNVKISLDHIADISYLGDARDIAIRWSISANHIGDGTWGAASNAPIYILGATHWRVINGRIKEETTVFDELALLRQIETQRLLS